VQSGLASTLRTPDNSGDSSGFTFGTCAQAVAQRIGVLRFSERFGTAFATRSTAAFVDADTSPTPPAQNVPGNIYLNESMFYAPGLTAPTGDYGTIGLATSGTRLKAALNNIPTGASVFVSTKNVVFANGSPSVASTGAIARLIQNEATAFAALAPTNTLDGIPVVQLQVINGAATAVWEVLRANPNAIENIDFAIWVTPRVISPAPPQSTVLSLPRRPLRSPRAMEPRPALPYRRLALLPIRRPLPTCSPPAAAPSWHSPLQRLCPTRPPASLTTRCWAQRVARRRIVLR